MRKRKRCLAALLLALPGAAAGGDLDHSRWDALVKRYVTPDSRVEYQPWKQSGLADVDAYVRELAEPWPNPMSAGAIKAALINAYNALTVRWILANYPAKSIWTTSDPFKAARHSLNGEQVSLDAIESRLRNMGDPRIHAALVCAAQSCPPLRREAYVASRIDEQLDDNTRRWLADRNLNDFSPERRTARVSQIFKWYGEDFERNGESLREFLARYAPSGKGEFLRDPAARIDFQAYVWTLNDVSSAGRYSRLQFYWDWLRNVVRGQGHAAKRWFLSLGERYGVNPIIFGSIYVGAVPFFSASIAWLIRNLRRRRSIVAPALCASFCFVSAYLYLAFAGHDIPAWVYFFIAAMLAFGVYSTVRKVKARLREGA